MGQDRQLGRLVQPNIVFITVGFIYEHMESSDILREDMHPHTSAG
jgi:hypothetical protein